MTTTWTREQTIERRQQWNDAVRAGLADPKHGGPVGLMKRLGFHVGDLKIAVDHHDLDNKRPAREAWLATPDGLRSQREDLARAHRSAVEWESDRHHAAFDGDDLGTAPDRSASDAAHAALAAFDAAHPEVLAAIKAERGERALRNVWN